MAAGDAQSAQTHQSSLHTHTQTSREREHSASLIIVLLFRNDRPLNTRAGEITKLRASKRDLSAGANNNNMHGPSFIRSARN